MDIKWPSHRRTTQTRCIIVCVQYYRKRKNFLSDAGNEEWEKIYGEVWDRVIN